MMMDRTIEMETIFGDGSKVVQVVFFPVKLGGAEKRVFTGEAYS